MDIICLAYLDYILIYSDNEEDHVAHVGTILQRLKEVGLALKLPKCEFHTSETEYLGYIVTPTGIHMDKEKIRTINEWTQPTNVKGIQSFLGFANFYRQFIKDSSRKAAPLTKLMRKDTPWEWTDETQEVFETIKHSMMSEPIIQHFDPTKPIILETDASD